MIMALTWAATFNQARVTISANDKNPQPAASLQRFCMALEAVKVSRKKKMPTVICDWRSFRISISSIHAPIKIIPMTRGTSVRERRTFLPGEDRFDDGVLL